MRGLDSVSMRRAALHGMTAQVGHCIPRGPCDNTNLEIGVDFDP